MDIRLLLSALAIYSATTVLSAAEPSTWPQWRGPQRDGTVTGPAWPESLNEATLRPRWEVTLGPSYSGPIVAADRIFVTETRDRTEEFVLAFDRKTGQKLWEVGWPGSLKVPFFAAENGSWIRATPAYDGESLYVGGIRDLLVCLDAKTGSVKWRVDFVEALKSDLPSFGMVCSPLVHGDHLYVQAGGAFVKLNKRTGEIVWSTLKDGGGMNGSTFSSPTITTLGGVKQLLVQTRTRLAGVDPQTGRELWGQEIEAFRGMNILTPIVYQERVFTSAYGGKSHLFGISLKDSQWKVDELWDNKVQGYMSTPVVIDGHAYLHLRNQRFTCLNLTTGKDEWTTTPFGKYWSLVANGSRILALDETGTLRLIAANPKEFQLIDERKVATESAWAHLAVCDHEVAVRSLRKLVVFDWKTAP